MHAIKEQRSRQDCAWKKISIIYIIENVTGPKLRKLRVGIIGFGHMGRAIYESLRKKGFKRVLKSDGEKNIEVAKKSDVLIIAVKPAAVEQVLQEIAHVLQKNQILISIAAGIPLKAIMRAIIASKRDHFGTSGVKRATGASGAELEHDASGAERGRALLIHARQRKTATLLIRAMPNLPAKIGMGMSVWKSLKPLSNKNKTIIKSILRAFGEEIEVKSENLIDAATAVSGSGPAYVFAFLQALSKAANKLGFSQKEGQLLALQTILGSAKYAAMVTTASTMTPAMRTSFESLVSQVKTKGGTTEAAFKILEKKHWQKILQEAIQNAYKRARMLGKCSY